MMPRFKAELRDKKEDQFKKYIVGKEIKGFEKFLGGNAAASRFLKTCKDKLAEAKSMKDTQAESKVVSLITKLKSSVLELNAELSEWITYSGGGEGGSPMYSKGSNKENMFLTDQIFSMAAPMDINEETGEVGFVIVQSDGMQKLVTYKAATKNLFLKAFKEAGIERLPKRNINDPFRFKMLNATKSTEKLVDFALSLDKAPQNLVKPYEKEILTQYNKLIKSEKPFSKEMLKEEVFKNVPEKTFKIADATFENVYKRTLSKAQKNKIIDDRKLKQLPRKTIIDNLLDGKSNIKQLAKASNLSTKEVGNEIQQLFRQIYQSREQAGAKQKVTNLILKDYSTKEYQKIL